MSRASTRTAIALLTGVIIGGLTTGVTWAATNTASAGVKACANSAGDLALLNKGKCTHGYKATTISKTGATGKTGPRGKTGVPGKNGVGATSASIDISTAPAADVNRTIGVLGADTFTLRCTSDLQSAQLYVNAQSDTFLHGVGNSTGYTYFSRTGAPAAAGFVSIATEVTGGLGDPDFDAFFYDDAAAYASGHVLVIAGTTTGTLDFSLYADGSRCQADAQLTPSSPPAG